MPNRASLIELDIHHTTERNPSAVSRYHLQESQRYWSVSPRLPKETARVNSKLWSTYCFNLRQCLHHHNHHHRYFFSSRLLSYLHARIQIGPHGAGLFHVIFTPDRASLIELQIDHTTERKHFNNLARWSGHGYTSRGGPNPVNTEDATSMVRKAVIEMDLSKHWEGQQVVSSIFDRSRFGGLECQDFIPPIFDAVKTWIRQGLACSRFWYTVNIRWC